MKRLDHEILRYLYKNDTGEFIDIYKVFLNNRTTVMQIDNVLDGLNNYIDIESIYNYRGVIILGENESINDETRLFLKVKINQKGREKYENDSNASISSRTSKRTTVFALIGLVITVLGLFGVQQIRIRNMQKEIIPSITINIKNLTDEDKKVNNIQDFWLWYPGSSLHKVG